MSAESPRHARSGGPLIIPSQPPSDRSLIDAVSGFINDVTLSSSSTVDPKDIIQWARFETADINEPTSEGDSDNDISPLLLILGYGSGVQVWLIPPNGEAQEVLSWRQGIVRVLRILPTPQHGDCYASKRPLIALCDSASPGPTFCSLSFISIRGGEQVKNIKFKNPILDVLANKRSVVVSFSERFAVFDAGTLEDRLTITTCYPCPCPLGGNSPINPLALGDRWLAYADRKLNPSKRSSGGCEGEGVSSYTATVLYAAKSLSKGLRGLGETVAHSLAGGRSVSQSPSPPNADIQQRGVVTILDIEGNEEEDGQDGEDVCDPVVAHFVAHSEAIIALKFDVSGVLLVTADRRGHDFHVFRINPHPCGPSLASVHHLYILHRGDTTAKVQDIALSVDGRWCAVSTLRGTTHVFPISTYGGACGVRTHTQPRVVNRLSRFHRSAGLPIQTTARSASPVGDGIAQGTWFPNPRLPPYPMPTTVSPLAQLRPNANLPTHTITRNSSGRQRLSSLSEESVSGPLLARAHMAPPPPISARSSVSSAAPPSPAALALYLITANGSLMHLLLHPRPARGVPKDKICDESPIELEVEPVAQWPLQRPVIAADLLAPLPPSNPLLQPMNCRRCADMCISEEERWLSQVEIVTHAGPHRRLWMGPQFVFKTYNCTGSNSSLSEAETVEVEAGGVARSNPVNMPARPLMPVIVHSGSASSLEHSPSENFRRKSLLAESGRATSVCDVQLREDLAEAMKEDHGWPREEIRVEAKRSPGVVRAVDPIGTVVIPTVAPDPVIDDPDLYTHSNADETTFRPVVRAHAALAICPDMVVRPLPHDTTIPVQTVPLVKASEHDVPMPLNTDFVIPAVLSSTQSTTLDVSDKSEPALSYNILFSKLATELPDRHVMIDNEYSIRSDVKIVDSINVEVKAIDLNKDLNLDMFGDECKKDSMSECLMIKQECTEISLPKSNRPTVDIQPLASVRRKKSPTLKLVKASDSDTGPISYNENILLKKKKDYNLDDNGHSKVTKQPELSKDFELIADKNIEKVIEAKTIDDTIRSKEVYEDDKKLIKTYKSTTIECEERIQTRCSEVGTTHQALLNTCQPFSDFAVRKNEDEYFVEMDLKSTIEDSIKSGKSKTNKIKNEDQAWDMLLNESDKIETNTYTEIPIDKLVDEKHKSKSKKNRKKTHEDSLGETDENSFVEIHTIEEKHDPRGDLACPSTQYDDLSTLNKSKSKCNTRSFKHIGLESSEDISSKFVDCLSKREEFIQPTSILQDLDTNATKLIHANANTIDHPKNKKSKSISSFPETRKFESVAKDLYVINTSEEDFPDIQITGCKKVNKVSPQRSDTKVKEEEPIYEKPKPIISWSSIASKNFKKDDIISKQTNTIEKNISESDAKCQTSSIVVSLQDKLFEICKRRDIVIAQCDEPDELNFVEEHHTSFQDSAPLQTIAAGVDDFNIDALRDSVLDDKVTDISSPICNIDIDDILSSIKETTSKVIESSMVNLVDLENLPTEKDCDFNVVESHQFTTKVVNVDDVKGPIEVIEKFSDEDPSPFLSADSDKEEKKTAGASNMKHKIILPSAKQSAKNKKSRRKK